jgi:hypothetical protein
MEEDITTAEMVSKEDPSSLQQQAPPISKHDDVLLTHTHAEQLHRTTSTGPSITIQARSAFYSPSSSGSHATAFPILDADRTNDSVLPLEEKEGLQVALVDHKEERGNENNTNVQGGGNEAYLFCPTAHPIKPSYQQMTPKLERDAVVTFLLPPSVLDPSHPLSSSFSAKTLLQVRTTVLDIQSIADCAIDTERHFIACTS